MLNSPVFWLVLCVVILIIVWFTTHYVLVRKESSEHIEHDTFKDHRYGDVSIEEYSSSESYIYLRDDSLPMITEIVPVCNTPPITTNQELSIQSLPRHIQDPDYRQEHERNVKKRSKGEQACKDAAEKIFGVQFATIRPPWLTNDETGRCMELDIFNEDLMVAIEYQGIQHSVYVPFLHKNDPENFEKQKQRDVKKRLLCKEHGVHLIIVDSRCPVEKIEDYIRYRTPSAIREREAAKDRLM